jgi:hypothetical protein
LYLLICTIYLISTRCYNIGGDMGIHEEIHLRHAHGYFLLQIPFMFNTIFGRYKTKGHTHDRQNRSRSH